MDNISSGFSFALQKALTKHQMDVKTAFVTGDLQEDLYRAISDDAEAEPGTIHSCSLWRSCFHVNEQEDIRNVVDVYKYISCLQLRDICHKTIEKKLHDKFLYRANSVLWGAIFQSVKVKVIKTSDVSLLAHSGCFGVIKWIKTDLQA